MVNANIVLIGIETAGTVTNVIGDPKLVRRADVRQRIERENRFGNRADATVRNAIACERQACQWIAYCNVRQRAEITIAHRLCRHSVLHGLSTRKLEPFKGAEEEGFVAALVSAERPKYCFRKPDGAAAAATIIVGDLLWFRQRTERI